MTNKKQHTRIRVFGHRLLGGALSGSAINVSPKKENAKRRRRRRRRDDVRRRRRRAFCDDDAERIAREETRRRTKEESTIGNEKRDGCQHCARGVGATEDDTNDGDVRTNRSETTVRGDQRCDDD